MKKIFAILCLFFFLPGCIVVYGGKHNLLYDHNKLQGQELFITIKDFFLENGFCVLDSENEIVFQEKNLINFSSEGNCTKYRLPSYTLFIDDNDNVQIEWSSGRKRKKDDIEKFNNLIEEYIEKKLNVTVSIVPKENK